MSKILITGVAGLLGSRLSDWVINNTNYEVVGIDDLSGGFTENINPKVKFYKFNLTNLEKLKEVFKKENIEIIYHFAAYAAEGLSPFIRKFNYENNVIASSNLITCSIEFSIKRFIFASSMAVYGEKYEPPFHEDLLQAPIDPYGVAKYAVEMDLKIASHQHGLNYTIIRPHNFYGINQNIWDKYRNVLGIWMYQILNKESPTIFGDGSQVRAFSYVDDSVIPFWNASQNDDCKGEIINLGGTKEYSISEACNILINVTGQNIKPVYLEPRHESKYAWATWDKSIELLGFEHKVNLEEGAAKMWEWAKKQPNRERYVWPEYELNKGIYEYWKS
ncbi:NAD-dependent epimerase/dehydratase family protein [Candidatus Pelagibacter ubique]|jgi:UDP-glucose 4-epimerase|nr:NAD-dependent epimerase/dehydratase family protein [Candidatus Pelagibacter ubique]